MMKKVLVMIGLFSLLVGLVSSYSVVPSQGNVVLGTSPNERVGVGIIPGTDQSAVGAKLEVIDMDDLVIAEIKGMNRYGAGFDLASYASNGERWRFLVSANGSRAGNLEFQTKMGSDETHMVISKDGNVGIGTVNPVRKLHINDAMKLGPLSSPPENPSSGDIYFDSSEAFCGYVSGKWINLGGTGICGGGTGDFPIIKITDPDGVDDVADNFYTITWTDEDEDSSANISLYYDIDNAGEDGTLIVSGIKENCEKDSYTWDTSNVSEGYYYVYAVIDDGLNRIVDYSENFVVNHVIDLSERSKIIARNGEAGDRFGNSVSVSGGYAIVGAPHADGQKHNSGFAYIFKRNGGGGWSQQARFGDIWAESDNFGSSVSISGDYAVVSSRNQEINGEGAVYVLKREGDSWSQQTKLYANDRRSGDYFGNSVSIDGDYFVAGTKWDDDNGANSGSAYIFRRDGRSWSQQAKITASDGAAGDEFGDSVSIDGDYAIVGAYKDDDDGQNSGSAYIFRRNGTSWSEEAKITASDGVANDYFGESVSIDGDYAVVSAYLSVYVFYNNGTNWVEQAKLNVRSNGGAYGNSVSVSGDYVIIGNSNSTYVFKRNGMGWSKEAELLASDWASDDLFGCSVSIDGDYAIVGAINDDDNAANSGSAYIYELP